MWFRRQWEPSMALEQGTDVIQSRFQKEKVAWRWGNSRQLRRRCQ